MPPPARSTTWRDYCRTSLVEPFVFVVIHLRKSAYHLRTPSPTAASSIPACSSSQYSLCGVNHRDRIDQPGAAPGVDAAHRLAVLQIRFMRVLGSRNQVESTRAACGAQALSPSRYAPIPSARTAVHISPGRGGWPESDRDSVRRPCGCRGLWDSSDRPPVGALAVIVVGSGADVSGRLEVTVQGPALRAAATSWRRASGGAELRSLAAWADVTRMPRSSPAAKAGSARKAEALAQK